MSSREFTQQARMPGRGSRLRGGSLAAIVFITAAAGLAAGCGSRSHGAPLSGSKQVAAIQADNVLAQMAKSSNGNFNKLSPTDRQRLVQIIGRQAPIALRQQYAAMQMQGKAR
ncbi:MAG TPA: hypothetical protein VFW40_07220 [Capsulimonadaceae bacterium]|nr:hypothetical protein [Capsulimonadaceae bacterium]